GQGQAIETSWSTGVMTVILDKHPRKRRLNFGPLAVRVATYKHVRLGFSFVLDGPGLRGRQRLLRFERMNLSTPGCAPGALGRAQRANHFVPGNLQESLGVRSQLLLLGRAFLGIDRQRGAVLGFKLR